MNPLSSSKFSNKIVLSVFIWACIAIALCCFFLYIHPFIVYDMDDWTYVCRSRVLWPSISKWNPIKVLPELAMSFLGSVGAYFIYPLNGDYIDSLSLSYGIAAVSAILLLCLLLYEFYRKVFALSELRSTVLILFFLLVGFLIYKRQDSMMYFFYAQSVNIFYNYDFPGIVNAIAVLFAAIYLYGNQQKKKLSGIATGGFILLAYLCINSNLLHSIILTSFVSAYALIEIVKGIKVREAPVSIAKRIWAAIVIDAAWLISMLFEINGGRADAGNAGLDIKSTIGALIGSLGDYNSIWLIVTFVIIFLGLVLYSIGKDTAHKELYIALFISCVVTGIYLILLCSKVSSGYITVPQAIWGVLFYAQLLSNIALAKLLQNEYVVKVVPLLLFFAFFSISNDIYKYRESNVSNYRYAVAKRIDEDIIAQICTAEEEGKTEVIVYTPYFGDETSDGWPFSSYGGERIEVTLYRHRIINRDITVTFERSEEKNAELRLP